MSHKAVASVCLVIDASIARAAGPPESKHPTGAACREFLQKVRGVCHRMAWNDAIKVEWDKHQSKFATAWRVSMVRLGKLRPVPNEVSEDLREAIASYSADSGVVAVLLKDAHLVEAALASDLRIASLDNTVRGHLCGLSAAFESLRQIVWVDPTAEESGCSDWLEAGAADDPARRLSPQAGG